MDEPKDFWLNVRIKSSLHCGEGRNCVSKLPHMYIYVICIIQKVYKKLALQSFGKVHLGPVKQWIL